MRPRLFSSLSAVLAAIGLFILLASMALAQEAQTLQIGKTAQGEVTTRLGQEWVFEACAGDVITITMTSTEFDTFLELYAPTGRESVATNDNGGSGTNAEIGGFELTDTGRHLIVAAGSSIFDRGPYSLTLIVSGTVDMRGLGATVLSDTVPVTGVVSSVLGEEWLFRGCASQAVTLTMQSEDFSPLLELYNSSDREPLVAAAAPEGATTTEITDFRLPQNDIYAVIAAGANRLDRGPYTLTLLVTNTVTLTPTESATQTTPTTTPTSVSAAPATEKPVCSVVSASLNLRTGPGIIFQPPIGALLQEAQLLPLARNLDASWIEVEVVSNGRRGWVSTEPQFVACNIDLATLELGIIPPTPTATNTPLPTATPLPTSTPAPTATTLPTNTPAPTPTQDPLAGLPSPQGVVIQSPGGTGDLEGNIYTAPQIVSGTNARDSEPVFDTVFYLEAFAFDPNIPGYSARSGAGIDRVEFHMFCPNGGEFVHTEAVPRYCMFGGGEPNCSVLNLVDGATIPGSDCRVENGFYDVEIQVFPQNSNLARANWNLTVKLEPPGSDQPETGQESQTPPEPQESSALVAQIVRTGEDTNGDSFSDALVFQVQAYDPDEGDYDGAGIDYVNLVVVGPDGSPVYAKRENDAAYCAFGGGEPCVPWVYADNDNKWPSGVDFTPGRHRLLAEAHARDGSTTVVERTVNIQ